MSDVTIVAYGAVSALGDQQEAVSAGTPGLGANSAIRDDLELSRVQLPRPFAARASVAPVNDGRRAEALLARALTACASELDTRCPAWRSDRVGLVLGTASGAMRAAELMFETIDRGAEIIDAQAGTYFGPMAVAASLLRVPLDPYVLILGACASASLALGLAKRWLERGTCDLILAGGFDEVSVFVAAGFSSLRAIAASVPPRPFGLERDGMALGEGAAVLALARTTDAEKRIFLSGFGAASDAVHLTAPDRAGSGLARAAKAALREAGSPQVDLVSAHATATPMNDAAEFRALEQVLGSDQARSVVVHPFKAQIGHTMGAAGALELLAGVDALERRLLPAAIRAQQLDPQTPVRLLSETQAAAPRTLLKLSSAFGGANSALVVSDRLSTQRRAARPCFVHAAAHVRTQPPIEELSARIGASVDRLARCNGLALWSLSAVARVQAIHGSLRGAGIVVGTALATIETNAVFAKRLRDHGATSAQPRMFPYTSPNSSAGECAIAFGLTGPSFAVGGGTHAAIEALAVATVLVEAGDADEIVVVAADDVGPLTRMLEPALGATLEAGAVAVVLSARSQAPTGSAARVRVSHFTLSRGGVYEGRAPEVAGHLALLPLVHDGPVRELAARAHPDIFARLMFEPV